MHEPLTLELTVDVLRDLSAAFPQKMDDKAMVRRAEVYRNNLQGLSGSALRWAAKTSIQEDSFFPKIARLRELANRWTTANAPQSVSLPAGNNHCSRCNTSFEWRKQWRPKVTLGGWGNIQLTADGQWLFLVSYERSLCKCDPPSPYFPDVAAPTDEAAMRLLNEKGGTNVSLSLMKRIREDARKERKTAPDPIVAKVPEPRSAA